MNEAVTETTGLEQTAPASDTQPYRDFVALSKEKSARKADLEALQEKINALEQKLIGQMEQTGVQRIHVDGMTVFLKLTLRARATNIATLAANPATKFMVKKTVHGETISAWVRERREEGDLILDELQDAISVYEQFSVGTRKA